MSDAERDLLTTTEGVDEGSAASTAEGVATGAAQPPAGAPQATEPAAAPPDDMESEESRTARDAAGPGQQLETGEG
jgi:hypothetical protein